MIKFCEQGKCVIKSGKTTNQPIDGGWSDWPENWSECSSKCDIGVMYKKRKCDNPTPKYGGKHCLGKSKLFKSCVTTSCQKKTDDFHVQNEQCLNMSVSARVRYSLFENEYLTFYFNKYKPCRLFCQPLNKSIYYDMMTKVNDGARCMAGFNDICIDGACNVS